MDLNYFTCTLGQAALIKEQQKHFETINDLLDYQAQDHADLPAVGFYRPKKEKWKTEVSTFADVRHGSVLVARLLQSKLDIRVESQSENEINVALLCQSNADFLFTWLGLIRLGYAVLLIAPQLDAAAIAQLCLSTNTKALIYADEFRKLISGDGQQQVTELKQSVQLLEISALFSERSVWDLLSTSSTQGDFPRQLVNDISILNSSTAYLHHTSGTSSGVPKAIPQPHHAAVGCLPLLDGTQHATFTTTPLYHGGIADLFRAWTSNALMWLFPGGELPITATNVVACLEYGERESEPDGCQDGRHGKALPRIAYFSSVPYVLQMMSESQKGLAYLRGMDMVGVGGAALAKEIGDRLVDKGVQLVSRFGSAECGFLMSSFRDFDKDRAWCYLRVPKGVDTLAFDARESGLCELVVKNGWPHMV
jgi:acyl-CoA synthetase (AMP-forming)/AMP-acid ligase II